MQNLAASGDKPLDILFSQGLVENTVNTFTKPKIRKLRIECLKLFDIIIISRGALLSSEDKLKIQKCLVNHNNLAKPDPLFSKVLYSILQVNNFMLEDAEASKLLELITLNTIFLDGCGKIYKDSEIIHMLNFRLLSKLFEKNHQYLGTFLESLEVQDFKISKFINEMTLNPKYFGLVKEFLWFAGSILQSTHSSVPRYLAYDNFINNIIIPKMFKLLE